MYIFINKNTEEISHPKSETHKGTREKWTHNACNYFFCLCGFLCKSYLFPPDYSVFKSMQTSFHGKSSLKCWEGKLLMPLWALPVRCAGLPALVDRCHWRTVAPREDFPKKSEEKCLEHILPVELQIPIDCHHGQEAKQKAKQAACEVTTPKGKYYSISSLHRGSFPWYTPPLRRKKICSLLYILHRSYTSQSIIQLRRIYIQSCVSWPHRDVNMFLLSDAMDRQVLGAGDSVFWAPFLPQSHFTACLSLDPLNPRFWPRPPNWSPWLRVSLQTQVSHGQWSFKGTSQKRPESCRFSLPITGYNPSFFGAHLRSTTNGWPRRCPNRSRMSTEWNRCAPVGDSSTG